MTNWKNRLPQDVFERLCNCKSRKADLNILVNAKWADMVDRGLDKKGLTKSDALVSVLELLDSNGQTFELTHEEWNDLCKCK